MIHKTLDSVTKEDVMSLLNNGVSESKSIEYKKTLPGQTDEEKKEFLADASSFANAIGGDILYGVEARDGVPVAINGLPNFTEDSEVLRIESILRDGISPRIPGVQIKSIPAFQDGPVLIVRLPRSWTSPHMINFKNWSRFYSRSSAGKYQLNVRDIQLAFDQSGDIPTKIRRWRDERLGKAIANDGPVTLDGKGKLILHLIPLEAINNPSKYHASELVRENIFLPPLGSQSYNKRINIDGLLSFDSIDINAVKKASYAQLFRSGSIESVNSGFLRESNGKVFVPSAWYEEETIKSVKAYLKSLKILQASPPYIFMLSMLEAKGSVLTVSDWHTGGNIHRLDRDILILPEIIIESADCELEQILRPAFDSFWNAFGFVKSFNYDDSGAWDRGRRY